jgi:hypothetical protein
MTARPNQASAVHGLKCADLVDAMGRLHRHRCHILDLVTPTPGRVLFGSAVTISYFPSCSAALDPERYNLANLFYEAVGDEPAGKVIVLASNGYTDTSMGAAQSCCGWSRTGAPGCSRTAACATSTSLRATTSQPTPRVRRLAEGGSRSSSSLRTTPPRSPRDRRSSSQHAQRPSGSGTRATARRLALARRANRTVHQGQSLPEGGSASRMSEGGGDRRGRGVRAPRAAARPAGRGTERP